MRIIVNADDFGYSEDTVEATIAAFERGLLTSATIMPRMPASAAAIAYARTRPDRSFGVHLTFVGRGEERCVEVPERVSHLAYPDGRLRSARRVRMAAILGRIPAHEIRAEADAQIRAVVEAGVAVSHVDSHRHLHKLASFREALRATLPDWGIRRVRAVQDVYVRRPLRSPTYWLGGRWQRSVRREFATTDHFYMPTSARDENWERVAERLPALGGTTLEVGLHPGEEEEWRRSELRGLEPFVDAVRRAGHELVDWRAITPPPLAPVDAARSSGRSPDRG